MRKMLFILLISILVIGCGDQSPEAWLNPVYEGNVLAQWKGYKVDSSRIHKVTNDNILVAKRMLKKDVIREITDEEIKSLVGKPIPRIPGYKLYLVRAVCYGDSYPGNFVIATHDEYMRVHFSSVGAESLPLKHQPLIVQLKSVPRAIFVTHSMDE